MEDDPKHVQHIQNLWGNPLTAAAAESIDDKAVYVQLNLAGQQGETLANESLEAVRNVVLRTPCRLVLRPGSSACVIHHNPTPPGSGTSAGRCRAGSSMISESFCYQRVSLGGRWLPG